MFKALSKFCLTLACIVIIPSESHIAPDWCELSEDCLCESYPEQTALVAAALWPNTQRALKPPEPLSERSAADRPRPSAAEPGSSCSGSPGVNTWGLYRRIWTLQSHRVTENTSVLKLKEPSVSKLDFFKIKGSRDRIYCTDCKKTTVRSGRIKPEAVIQTPTC